MIHVTRLNHADLIINADLIEFIESTPDTVLTLLTGKKMMVLETPDQIVERVIEYRHKVGPVIIRPIDPLTYELAQAEHDDEN
ncbi:MAG TPA: flagellar FlbD family protein [Capsulimonadaceae bacterium]|jgi:flagellar protein FlbD